MHASASGTWKEIQIGSFRPLVFSIFSMVSNFIVAVIDVEKEFASDSSISMWNFKSFITLIVKQTWFETSRRLVNCINKLFEISQFHLDHSVCSFIKSSCRCVFIMKIALIWKKKMLILFFIYEFLFQWLIR